MKTIQTKFKETEIGTVPEEWDVVDIDGVLDIIDGDRGVNYPNGSDFSDNGYCVFLNAKNVCGDSFDFSNCQFISQAKDAELRKGKMQRGDFVLTTRGTVGNIAFYDRAVPFENMRINSGMVILRNDKDFDSKYLFQFLKSWITKKQILELTTGSAQPQLPIKDLKNLKLIRPTIDEQKQIAEILSSLDDKIELNRRINANLEKIASSLFKHWFVDNVDYLKWKATSIGQVVANEKNAIVDGPFGTQMKISEYVKEGVPIVEMGYLEGYPLYRPFRNFITEEKYQEVKRSTVREGDIIISKTGTLGLLGIMTRLWDKAILVSRLAKITPDIKKVNRYYLFQVMKNFQKEEYWNSQSSGSTMPIINLTHIKSAEFISPPIELQNQYGDTVENFYQTIHSNLLENQNLSNLRDSLLPRLMNGKIRIKIC